MYISQINYEGDLLTQYIPNQCFPHDAVDAGHYPAGHAHGGGYTDMLKPANTSPGRGCARQIMSFEFEEFVAYLVIQR